MHVARWNNPGQPTFCRHRRMCGRAPGRGTGSCRYDRPASAEDEQFMRMALDEARHGDLPYSTVIVRDGQVIARAKFGPDE